MIISQIITGVKKYITGYWNYARKIEGMKPFYFLLDGVWCWIRYGCVYNQFTDGGFYKYRSYHRKKILTYRNWKKIIKVNNPNYIQYLKNKVEFNTYFCDYVGREWLYSGSMTQEEFILFSQRHKQAIIKPIDDWEGNGIILEDLSQEKVDALYIKYKSENVLIEEVVKQHPDMVFNNKSVNTIRVYSIYDEATRNVCIIKTTLRAGVGNSVVDNSHSGGISYEIDIDSGRIISMGWSRLLDDGQLFHKNSNICMLGRAIPYWDEVKTLVREAALKIPEVKYVGWDVAVLENGPILIEGNHDPDLDIMEFVGRSGYLTIIKQYLNF